VAQEVGTEFERFWASASAYPLAQLVPPATSNTTTTPEPASPLTPLAVQMENPDLPPEVHAYLQAVTQSKFVTQLLAQNLALEWVRVELVSDDPDKVLDLVRDPSLMRTHLAQILGEPKREFYLVSPYFVPTRPGYDWFAELRNKDVKVKVLTNALESTDVAAVHAGYSRWRRPLLEVGVALFETRRAQTEEKQKRSQGSGLGNSSGESLHAKTFTVDRSILFVGSFNFDPRSVELNTEMGLLIHSPHLAAQFAQRFDAQVAQQSYELRLGSNGQLQWLDAAAGPPGQPLVLEQEPNAGFWRNLYVHFLRLLPIDSLL
jgi:putative cardiolipin synthase